MRLLRAYAATAQLAATEEMQYRTKAFLLLLGFLIEPIVYLAVWRTVAEAQGGVLGGFTISTLTSYYIVWTLVRAMNLALTPYVWDWRIQRGRLNDFVLQPMHPFHRDMAWFIGTKPIWIMLWIPVAAVLWLTFRPAFSPTPFQVIAFAVVIWSAFALRQCILYLLGLVSFWTTKASSIFEIMIAAELLLSGHLPTVRGSRGRSDGIR